MTLIAIVSALHEELSAIDALLEGRSLQQRGGRSFHRGRLQGHEVLLVLSGIGKVAAASTATLALDAFGAQALLFTGVAGGLAPGVRVGDVVVARELLQHDLDVSPLFPRYVVPSAGRARFAADAVLADALAAAADEVLAQPHPALQRLGIGTVRSHQGLVVSGDRFVGTAVESDALRTALPDALAVEMEGAAVAQVCAAFGRPFAVLRTVSDRADDSAHVDFQRFIAEVAAEYSRDTVAAALRSL
ncbi:5'-methylthioadenosine/adenosylhomocysteine nucleosidase [Aquincola tertiaricarbonis]|uniref:5'-methylthioadenosine/adenosylhomocysteine nucleosidase n=1 Tax=Aquincola tertiaricarbonis TaxID=391953 RepID=UPI0006150A19|nr:5'-methylthioadenosine/adenosylhomocysteine nucleosidase [Aquincola tertiaricarbonis]